MNKRVYSAVEIGHVAMDRIFSAAGGVNVSVGVDVGKLELRVVVRWSGGEFERPWAVKNPQQIPQLVEVLQRLGRGREMKVAMEPTGTYGDALRQALFDGGIDLHLVSGKRAHDYAEVFDGVPSQHDGKDAAVVAELCSSGKSSLWRWRQEDELSQQIEWLVDQMRAAGGLKATWVLRLEGLLARHWPESVIDLRPGSGTMMRALKHYGGPAGMRLDEKLEAHLQRLCRGRLKSGRIKAIAASARQTLGVRQTPVDQQRVRWCAGHALQAHLEVARLQRCLTELGAAHPLIARQGKSIGIPTACVLWRYLGDPRQYHCAAAYRKAMGLNLKERSSGKYQGQLKITKRGSGMVRQRLYLSALRLLRREPAARRWLKRKLRRGSQGKVHLITALMRKLAMSMWAVSVREEAFAIERLLGRPQKRGGKTNVRRKGVAIVHR